MFWYTLVLRCTLVLSNGAMSVVFFKVTLVFQYLKDLTANISINQGCKRVSEIYEELTNHTIILANTKVLPKVITSQVLI